MAEELGGECGYTTDYGKTCDEEAYNPVKILKDPVVTPDGRYHWKLDSIEYMCSEHSMECLIRGNTTPTKVSYEELEQLIKSECIQLNVTNRNYEKQEVKLKEGRE